MTNREIAVEKIILLQKLNKPLPWSWFKQLADHTEKIIFPCDFDERGACREHRHSEFNEVKCCCGGCSLSFGYFRVLPNNSYIAPRLLRKFDEKKGFWRKGKGCILPRHLRSHTCLGHVCGSVIQALRKTKEGKRDLKFLYFIQECAYPRTAHQFKVWLKEKGKKFSVETAYEFVTRIKV